MQHKKILSGSAIWLFLLWGSTNVCQADYSNDLDDLASKIEGTAYRPIKASDAEAAERRLNHLTAKLSEYIREYPQRWPDAPEVAMWPAELNLADLQNQLRLASPDVKQLESIHSKFIHKPVEVILDGNERLPAVTATYVGRHVRRAVGRAIGSYLILRDFAEDAGNSQGRFETQRDLLATDLRRYAAIAAEDAKKELLWKIHARLNWLRARHQAIAVTNDVRHHYLTPELQVAVSDRLMDSVSNLQLPSFPFNRTVSCTNIRSRIKPCGRLHIRPQESAERGVLTVGYNDPLVMRGTGSRQRITFGFRAGLHMTAVKRFYVAQDAENSDPATINSRLQYVNVTYPHLLSRTIERRFRGSYDGTGTEVEFEDKIDDAVTALWNLVNLENARAAMKEAESREFPRARAYESSDRDLQFRLLRSPRGFQSAPVVMPKLGMDEDFAVSLHEDFIFHVVKSLTEETSADISAAMVIRALAQAFVFGADSGAVNETSNQVYIWFPLELNEQLVFLDEPNQKLHVNFFAGRKDRPGEKLGCTVSFSSREGAILGTNLVVHDGTDDQKERIAELLKECFGPLVSAVAIRLPNPSAIFESRTPDWADVGQVAKINLKIRKNRVLTISGSLLER